MTRFRFDLRGSRAAASPPLALRAVGYNPSRRTAQNLTAIRSRSSREAPFRYAGATRGFDLRCAHHACTDRGAGAVFRISPTPLHRRPEISHRRGGRRRPSRRQRSSAGSSSARPLQPSAPARRRRRRHRRGLALTVEVRSAPAGSPRPIRADPRPRHVGGGARRTVDRSADAEQKPRQAALAIGEKCSLAPARPVDKPLLSLTPRARETRYRAASVVTRAMSQSFTQSAGPGSPRHPQGEPRPAHLSESAGPRPRDRALESRARCTFVNAKGHDRASERQRRLPPASAAGSNGKRPSA